MTVTRPVQGSFIEGMERPVGPIPPSVMTGTNADLIAAVAPLYLTGSVLDVTYGEGRWWDRFQPDPFVFHDKYKVDGVDFTALPEDDASFDAVCFDPPYVVTIGKATGSRASAIRDSYRDAFGIDRDLTQAELMRLIQAGLAECCRVSRRFVLVKCMEFAKAQLVDMPHHVTKWALELGCVKHDQIVHWTGSGPGGHNIFDIKRARRHHSYLLVFEVAE